MNGSSSPWSVQAKSWKFCVQPGRGLTDATPRAGSRPHSALSSDDLPQFERPQSATSGCASAGSSLYSAPTPASSTEHTNLRRDFCHAIQCSLYCRLLRVDLWLDYTVFQAR